jgi:hypothetical protein
LFPHEQQLITKRFVDGTLPHRLEVQRVVGDSKQMLRVGRL